MTEDGIIDALTPVFGGVLNAAGQRFIAGTSVADVSEGSVAHPPRWWPSTAASARVSTWR